MVTDPELHFFRLGSMDSINLLGSGLGPCSPRAKLLHTRERKPSCGLGASYSMPLPSRGALQRAHRPEFAEKADGDYQTIEMDDVVVLSRFTFYIVYKKGNLNTQADSLCQLEFFGHTTASLDEKLPTFPDDNTKIGNRSNSCPTWTYPITSCSRMGAFKICHCCPMFFSEMLEEYQSDRFRCDSVAKLILAKIWPFQNVGKEFYFLWHTWRTRWFSWSFTGKDVTPVPLRNSM